MKGKMTAFYVVITTAVVLVILYFLAIMPRLGRKKGREGFMGVYYAHRGLHDNESQAPENSMKAFEKAVEAGYGIEMDIQLTKDRIPVVFHDFTLKRVCGQEGKVCDYTYEELQAFSLCGSKERIPRFQDVLERVNGRVPLIVELKVEWMDIGVCPLADRLLREYRGLYCIESFNPMALLWYRRYHNDVMRGQLSDAFLRTGEFQGALYRILQNLLLNWMTKPDFIAYNHKYADTISRRLCRSLYKNLAVGWTIKSQEELEEAKESFDLIIFDSFLPKKENEKDIWENKKQKKRL